jgi:Ser/Thr protein kinase RdoA (MazF antagonist)
VTTLHGQAVLVTEHVAGTRLRASEATFAQLGDLFGRLHTLPPAGGAGARPGGAWHHLVFAGDAHHELATRALASAPRNERSVTSCGPSWDEPTSSPACRMR